MAPARREGFADGVAPHPVGTLLRLSSGDCGVMKGAGGPAVMPRVLPASAGGTGLCIVAVGRQS